MNRIVCAIVSGASLAGSAQAATFSLTPVTNTTPNFAGLIAINGTVTIAPGELFISPLSQSSASMPFNASFTAGFNGPGQNWDPGFLAWSGVGTYSGPIFNHVIGPGNLGYSGGMPLGLYASNPLGPGGQAGLILYYIGIDGVDRPMAANHAVNVVPAPGAAAMLGLALLAPRRRRRG